MDMNNVNIEEIVKQVLSGMTGNAPAAAAASAPAAPAGNTIPKKARVAMMTEKKHFELQEYDLPEVGDDDILVKVEGCGVCGTDAHEYKNDPFGLIPVVLGHEGTGEIVKMGKNVKVDTAGKPVKVGDKIVTCMIFKDDPEITMFDLNKKNVGGADVYGLLPDDDVKFNPHRAMCSTCTCSRESKNNRNPEIQQQSCCSGLRTDRSDLYRRSSYNGCSQHLCSRRKRAAS